MNKDVLKDALVSALRLLNNEVQCVEDADLSEEYFGVINKIEAALKEVEM